MIVGTAGHIDHGKTALVKALTGVDGDRLDEEKTRGITIELGFAYADLGSGNIMGFVDVPGHERLIHTMVAGAGSIDVALLVVAADDGIMPQTLEHLAIIEQLGISRAIVAMTKADLATPERRAEVAAQIQTTLASTSLSSTPIIPVSSHTGEGIDTLRCALLKCEADTAARHVTGPLRFAVDRSFTLPGVGTVVTGIVLAGQVSIDDHIVVSPSGLHARVRGIHAQNRKASLGLAGQRCALNLVGDGITKDAVHRGDMILDASLHAPTDRIDAEFTLLASEPKAVNIWFPARLHSHAVETGVRLVPLQTAIAPGTTGLVQLVLERPIAAAFGDRFVLRDTSASRTIGGGRFLDLRAPQRKRGTPERLAALAALSLTPPHQALAALARLAPVDAPAFIRDRALAPSALSSVVAQADVSLIGHIALSQEKLDALRQCLHEQLETFHAENPDLSGIGREKLRLLLSPRLPKEAFLVFLNAESEARRVVLDGAFVRLPGHEVRLSVEEEALFERIQPQLLGEGRFRPPRVRDFAKAFDADERDVRKLLRLTQKLGRTDQIANDHFFAREVTREMVEIIRDLAAQSEDGWFSAPAFRDRVNNGRKVAIEIMDFFDRLGLTLRKGDMRRLNPHRTDLFGD
ncbi:selenocysteine-specific translation elongation factor [Pusillimonas sp. CC-YST705]|uniref:Selenocysteine-specific translation elongation factor n=1 Tax=Mesopusillimonas faecipullorum TaxID=2755040 RepID=A0ABS8CDB5_9BURK|nr:selenocysteine-specific translation elongation factor [Mesopusillimonas faecipullorum]MCB5364017.1 selenocysteine-specific translation elongation factor [Mesopusillimonas faecipullorum]